MICATILAFDLPCYFLGSAARAGDKFGIEDSHKLVQAVMMACLQNRDPESWGNCVGVSAASCAASMHPASTSEETVCIREELRQWKIQVKGLYSRLESDAQWRVGKRPTDAEQIEMHLTEMRKMRSNWTELRRSACAYVKSFWGDDSKFGRLELSRCEMQIAADHAIWLHKLTERVFLD